MQHFTTHKRYVHRPAGKQFDDLYTTDYETPPKCHDLGWHIGEQNGRTVFPITRNNHEWPIVPRFAKEQVRITHGRSYCKIFHAGWCNVTAPKLSPNS